MHTSVYVMYAAGSLSVTCQVAYMMVNVLTYLPEN